MIYIAAILLSLLICNKTMSHSCEIAENAHVSFFKIMVVILPLLLLAGFRSASIGTDTGGYVEPMFLSAVQSDGFADYLSASWLIGTTRHIVSSYDIGYTVLVYIVAQITNQVNVLLFVQHIFILFPLLLACRKLGNRYDVTICLWFYCFTFYNSSLNVARQSIALSFGMLAFAYLVNRKYLKAAISMITAFLFHSSAIIFVFIYLIYVYFTFERSRKWKFRIGKVVIREDAWKLLLISCIGIVILLSINVIADILTKIPMMARFAYVYLGGLHSFSWMSKQIMIRLPVLFLILFNYKNCMKQDDLFGFLAAMFVIELITSQFISFHSSAVRIGWYFSIFKMFLFSDMWKAEDRKARIMNRLLISAWLIFYYVYYYLMQNSGETMPYLPFWS